MAKKLAIEGLHVFSLLSLLGALGLAACDKKSSPKEEAATKAPTATPGASEAEKQAKSAAPSPTLPPLPALSVDEKEQTPAAVELGHALFFDKRLSVDGSVSCYSCHQNENGNGGATPTAVGAKGKKLTRHSPVIWNVAYLPKLYWDGRADSLEAQAKGAWGGGNMGVGADNLDKKALEMAKIPGYKKLFEAAYPGETPSADLVAKALSAYERTLICDDTAYDKYAAGDKSALSEEQLKGYEVFSGKGMCIACHAPPYFTSAAMGQGAFFNIGIGTEGVKDEDLDVGRMKVSEESRDKAAFKPPSLRNVSKSAPYFHDGSVASLNEAVHIMASGGIKNENLTPLMQDRALTKEESAQLLAFLQALDCQKKLEEPTLP